ncbi:signal peptide peptidase SppA [Erythrobacter sp.]|uniref:signal peptide peptidase SppA n=1 Tax=Erythrobacter sp. TaxID=1042 RepID=UPI001B03B012|nr:signal peptide peptidase SppA [Erythrobacter sp.]MBO6525645.1 signal peptide peptidase SppA [Erythrobacter sp.]MBO6529681.1 signal peptide peptidase SppA [Erythrobacter sp.]
MKFAGKVWRLLVGIKDGLVLVFMLLFFAALFAVLTARPSPAAVRDGALLLELDGIVVEERTEIDPIEALLSRQTPMGEYQARDLVHALDEAAKDERISAVVLDLDRFLGGGQVHLQEIGEALDRVRAAEKPVLAYATAYTDDGMLLAAHASEVWVNPLGGAVVTGPGGERLYYAGLLEKLQVNARVYKVGEYKSAVEPFSRSGMSEAARENARALYDTLWEEYRANLKKARPAADIERVTTQPVEWVANARGDLASAALQAGLVDKLGSRADFEKRVVELVGEDDWSEGPNAYPHTELAAWLEDKPLSTSGKPIGVITVAGEIVDGDAGPGVAGGDRIAELLDEALDDDLAGLVVRVDSPGGSVLASELIREAILRHKARDIPVAVSMANVAASGGYWVSTPADRIFAEPETITGSIGIFAVIPTFEQTAAMVGVTSDGVRTTPLSGQPDLVGGLTPETDALVQAFIEDGYEDFLVRVGAARDMTRAQVDAVAQGRVWDGGTARQLRLVDEYGGMEEALAWTAGQAGLGADWHVQYLGTQPSTYDTLLRQWLIGDGEEAGSGGDVIAHMARGQSAVVAQIASDAERLLDAKGAQAYCLACPSPTPSRGQVPAPNGWVARIVALLFG